MYAYNNNLEAFLYSDMLAVSPPLKSPHFLFYKKIQLLFYKKYANKRKQLLSDLRANKTYPLMNPLYILQQKKS